MNNQRSKINIMIALVLLCSSVILGGCGTNWNVNLTSSTEEPPKSIVATETQTMPTVAPPVIPTDAPTITPTSSPTNIPAILTDGTAIENINKDIDGNGVDDNIQIISLKDGSETCMHVFLNGEQIFEYEGPPYVRLMGVNAFEYLDLDGDGTNEIFGRLKK